MSHFTRVKTVIRDQVVLEESLRQLHYQFQVGERVPIRGWNGGREFGEVVVSAGKDCDIGFQRQSDQTFNVCADWWLVGQRSQIREPSFLNTLNQTYAHNAIRKQVLAEGLIIEEERVLQNGEIHLVVSQRL